VHRSKARHAIAINNLGSARKYRRYESWDILYVVFVVSVENEYVRSFGGGNARTHRGPFTKVRTVVETHETRIVKGIEQSSRVIGRPVVHNDNFELFPRNIQGE
jgi:hypothetical protein